MERLAEGCSRQFAVCSSQSAACPEERSDEGSAAWGKGGRGEEGKRGKGDRGMGGNGDGGRN